ncbi:MAG TPA: pantoate--beta-alanine ligase [Verrucomicrobiae bacterium]|nr:pantoate--beta-alanine ligase [Verrucomicrobiae bacterium]
MKIITGVGEMQEWSRSARGAGKTVALVPTMGYLHDGHASLMREGRGRCDLLVTSIFVNPTQFGVGEDFESYPRDLERDAAIAREAGVDVIFAPTAAGMYPQGYLTYVNVEELTLPLCGGSRPGHFRGVTTVVAKLFNIVQPDVALFGRKDFQQLAVIRRMAQDLNMQVQVVGMPIVRESDGLAMSSRNKYLSADQRRQALCLHRALQAARGLLGSGVTNCDAILCEVRSIIGREPDAVIDYAELRDPQSLQPVAAAGADTLLALAVRIGTTRLIDNCILGEEN